MRFRKILSRFTERPPLGVTEVSRFGGQTKIVADICIITNCAFVGGNASTTVTEYETFSEAGKTCVIVHCPVKRSWWKRSWTAERYLPILHHIAQAHAVKSIQCDTVIVRGPRMAMTSNFKRLAAKISSRRAMYVVNNSAWSENGKQIFDWNQLSCRVRQLALPNSKIYPISPVVRDEAAAAIANYNSNPNISKCDWPPAFKVNDFWFAARPQLLSPIIIGRHGRDHEAKWLENEHDLRASYPDRGDVKILVMGGADTPRKRLGKLPDNWEVYPFGASGVSEFLSRLDIFVNFPAEARDEAFGRTIIEAILAGLPTVLPPAFEKTFGDLALYCEPTEVSQVVDRLKADDEGRLSYIKACREEAARRFGSENLLSRLEHIEECSVGAPALDDVSKTFRRKVMGEVLERRR